MFEMGSRSPGVKVWTPGRALMVTSALPLDTCRAYSSNPDNIRDGDVITTRTDQDSRIKIRAQ